MYTEEEIAALCGAPGSGVNWDALVVNCPRVSDYRLFLNNEVTSSPNDGGVPFDLTTPLFSDYAVKYRFLFLPPGASAGQTTLAAAIEREGSSFDTFYLTPKGQPGSYQERFQVYGRAGQPCPRCGRAIRRIVVGQRGTHLCTRCQRRP